MSTSPSSPAAPAAAASTLETIMEERKSLIGPNCEVNYSKSPLLILRGEGQYLVDAAGERYLDCVNNVAHVGHSHPTVVSAVCTQMSSLITNSRYLHPGLTQYAKRILSYCPAPLSVMYWVNSGSEANDLALRMARAHTGRRGVVCVDGAYHGHTSLIIDVSPYKYAREAGAGERGYVRAVPQPDVYSGVIRGDIKDPAMGAAYAALVSEALQGFAQDEAAEAAWRAETQAGAGSAATKLPTMAGTPKAAEAAAAAAAAAATAGAAAAASSTLPPSTAWAARNTCDDGLKGGCGAFIMESILSCGGQVLPPPGYLPAVYAAVRAAGGVCIADEVQVGFGRVGAPHFWAFQLQGAECVPDIVTIGKPMGNGFPCAAVITTAAIAASFSKGMGYFNTFAGNPCASAAANAVLDVMEAERLSENAARVGAVLMEGFLALQARFGGSGAAGAQGEAGAPAGGAEASPAAAAGALPQAAAGCPLIGSVRGVGLMVGLEMVKSLATREPDAETAGKVKYALLAKKILISTDGECLRAGG
jgi:4-aminobutyrate aminotransferase-like enzyme